MDNGHQRHDSNGHGRGNKVNRKKAFAVGPSCGTEEGEKKPKFMDRFASIRMPGTKKERPHLPHVTKPTGASDWSNSSEFEALSSRITSEKEILALFEKMMEDMNLNEDKRAPLREKDLSMKREMVLQYVITAAKTGSLRSSCHQISPQEFLTELKSGATDERLFACLDSLRVSLTSNPVSWVQSFGHEGLGLLLDILDRLLLKKHQEKVDKKNQYKVIQCLRAFMNNKIIPSPHGGCRVLASAHAVHDPCRPVSSSDWHGSVPISAWPR
uniref:GBD/FH3 domain-containing protein n=1 Tax=Electrophorus electricus TaxID=8005 RepID=A0A4W4FFL3_ELEEL